MAVTLASDEAITPQMGAGGAPKPASPRGRSFEEALTGKAAELVKGVGHVTKGGRPLSDSEDGAQIFTKSHDAIMRTKAATLQGQLDTDAVLGGLSRDFTGSREFAGIYQSLRASSDVRKNFTATNQALAGTPYGLVPSIRAAS